MKMGISIAIGSDSTSASGGEPPATTSLTIPTDAGPLTYSNVVASGTFIGTDHHWIVPGPGGVTIDALPSIVTGVNGGHRINGGMINPTFDMQAHPWHSALEENGVVYDENLAAQVGDTIAVGGVHVQSLGIDEDLSGVSATVRERRMRSGMIKRYIAVNVVGSVPPAMATAGVIGDRTVRAVDMNGYMASYVKNRPVPDANETIPMQVIRDAFNTVNLGPALTTDTGKIYGYETLGKRHFGHPWTTADNNASGYGRYPGQLINNFMAQINTAANTDAEKREVAGYLGQFGAIMDGMVQANYTSQPIPKQNGAHFGFTQGPMLMAYGLTSQTAKIADLTTKASGNLAQFKALSLATRALYSTPHNDLTLPMFSYRRTVIAVNGNLITISGHPGTSTTGDYIQMDYGGLELVSETSGGKGIIGDGHGRPDQASFVVTLSGVTGTFNPGDTVYMSAGDMPHVAWRERDFVSNLDMGFNNGYVGLQETLPMLAAAKDSGLWHSSMNTAMEYAIYSRAADKPTADNDWPRTGGSLTYAAGDYRNIGINYFDTYIDEIYTGPTVTISTFTPTATPNQYTATITFSEAVTDLLLGDIDIMNGTVDEVTRLNVSEFSITATSDSGETFQLRVPEQVVEATAGNQNGNQTSDPAGPAQAIDLVSIVSPSATSPQRLRDGHVVGLVGDLTERSVQFSGTAQNGRPMEFQIVEADNHANIIVPQFTAPAATNGTFSISQTVPKSSVWLNTQYRYQGETAWNSLTTRWAVGYVFLMLGQSQMSILLKSSSAYAITAANADTASYYSWQQHNANGVSPETESFSLMGTGVTAGRAAFVNQFRVFDPDTPIMLIRESVNGTSILHFTDDQLSARMWSDLTDKTNVIGGAVTAVLESWNTANQGELEGNEDIDILQGIDTHTSEHSATPDHSLADVLEPGYIYATMPATRNSKIYNDSDHASAKILRANALGYPVGLPISDYEIDDDGGPHPLATGAGNVRLGARLAILAAECVGLTVPQKPYFTGTSQRSADGTYIDIDVTLPNGGTLTSPAPNALTGFGVRQSAGGAYETTGFTAAIEGTNKVRLTKDVGTWAPIADLTVRKYGNNVLNDPINRATEQAIMAGELYETWAGDVNGDGLPVYGEPSTAPDGLWYNQFFSKPTQEVVTNTVPTGVTMIGDSITSGSSGVTPFIEVAANTWGVPFTNNGASGTIFQNVNSHTGAPLTDPLMSSLGAKTLGTGRDSLICAYGFNDARYNGDENNQGVLGDISAANFEIQMRQALRVWLVEYGRNNIWLVTPHYISDTGLQTSGASGFFKDRTRAQFEEYVTAVRTLADEFGVKLVDTYAAGLPNSYHNNDNIHPDQASANAMGALVNGVTADVNYPAYSGTAISSSADNTLTVPAGVTAYLISGASETLLTAGDNTVAGGDNHVVYQDGAGNWYTDTITVTQPAATEVELNDVPSLAQGVTASSLTETTGTLLSSSAARRVYTLDAGLVENGDSIFVGIANNTGRVIVRLSDSALLDTGNNTTILDTTSATDSVYHVVSGAGPNTQYLGFLFVADGVSVDITSFAHTKA